MADAVVSPVLSEAGPGNVLSGLAVTVYTGSEMELHVLNEIRLPGVEIHVGWMVDSGANGSARGKVN